MNIDTTTLPISGGAIVAGIVWAGVSAFALGPAIAERTAQKIGWTEDCANRVAQAIAAHMPEPDIGMSMNCDTLLPPMPREYRQLYDLFGMGMACDAIDKANEQKRRLIENQRQRLENTAREADSKCACAVSHFTVSKRWDLALAAGTARLIVPGSVSNMRASLLESLASPACAGLARVEG